MNTISFLLTFTAISTLLFAYYFFLLRKEQQFQGNRFFLLSILPFSAILPFVEFPVFQAKEISPTFNTTLETITITSEEVNDWAWTHSEMLAFIYLGITMYLLLLLFIRLGKIVRYTRNSVHTEKIDGATIIHTRDSLDISSFGPYIFWNVKREFNEAERTQILSHELCHVRQGHSLDVLFLECWKIIFWFHPMIYLIDHELKAIHEYQADRAALEQSTPKTYIQLLLSKSLGRPLQLTHSFLAPTPKHRIMMILRKSHPRWAQVKYLCLLPFAALVFTACTINITHVDRNLSETLDEITYVAIKDPSQSSEHSPETSPHSNTQTVPLNQKPLERPQDDPEHIDTTFPLDNSLEKYFDQEKEEKRMADELDNSPDVEVPIDEPGITDFVDVHTHPQPKNLNELKKLVGYPVEARKAGLQGQVVLRVLVGKNGRYIRHEVVTHPSLIFVKQIEKHIKKLRFEPAIKDGKPVKYWVNIPFNFKLLN